MANESADQGTKLDAVTGKCTERFETFANSKSGNLILEFVTFKRNIVPYTLQILYVAIVIVAWLVGILGLIGKGPIGAECTHEVIRDGKEFMEVNYASSLGISIGVILLAPFIVHYLLEIVKFLWKFVLHCYAKVLIPLWETIVLRYLVNVLPQILPFTLERFMKFVDICVDRSGSFFDAIIDGITVVAMSIAALLKGALWLPMTLCQRLERWAKKGDAGSAK